MCLVNGELYVVWRYDDRKIVCHLSGALKYRQFKPCQPVYAGHRAECYYLVLLIPDIVALAGKLQGVTF